MYGYGCEPNFPVAMNWFEFASASNDPVIAEKALIAAKELHDMYELATETNNKVLEKYRQKAEKVQKAGSSDMVADDEGDEVEQANRAEIDHADDQTADQGELRQLQQRQHEHEDNTEQDNDEEDRER